jgi:hypothetical protein
MEVSGQLYAPAASPLVPIVKGLGGPHSWSRCFAERRNILPLLGIKTPFLGSPVCSLVTIPTMLSWFLKYVHNLFYTDKHSWNFTDLDNDQLHGE